MVVQEIRLDFLGPWNREPERLSGTGAGQAAACLPEVLFSGIRRACLREHPSRPPAPAQLSHPPGTSSLPPLGSESPALPPWSALSTPGCDCVSDSSILALAAAPPRSALPQPSLQEPLLRRPEQPSQRRDQPEQRPTKPVVSWGEKRKCGWG